MSQKPYLSVIIPAYNEEKSLPLTLVDMDKYLSQAGFEYEIIIVDNNSADATKEVSERMSHVMKNIRVTECKIPGKAATVKQGMLEANGSIRLFMDADNATTVDQFSKMIPDFNNGYDIVIGSRDIKGAQLIPPQPWYRRLPGNMGNLYIQALLVPGMWDTQCGFKAFTEEVAMKIFPIARVKGWGFDPELLSIAHRLGYKIKEIPVVWHNKAVSRIKFSSYFEVLWDVTKVWWRLLTDSYNLKSIPKKKSNP